MEKIRVAILFGGKSAEHEISLLSAKSVIDALPRDKYEPILIGIDKRGGWHVQEINGYLTGELDPYQIKLKPERNILAIDTGNVDHPLIPTKDQVDTGRIDVVFPVLHGTNGEDGTVQGLLKLAGIPFVGPGVLGSAVGMDKDVAKRLLRDAGIPNADFVTLRKSEKHDYHAIEQRFGYPCFVKPCNLGSSVGVSKAKNREELATAIHEAFRFDTKVLVEKFVHGREIECAVLGNIGNMQASLPGEVIPQHEFYSYEAKYVDEQGAILQIPVELPEETVKRVQELAIRTCATLECEGMARVDLFVTKFGDIYLNEINTIPGFTKISMYPKLWEVSGLPYPRLIDRLIQLALERHERDVKLVTER